MTDRTVQILLLEAQPLESSLLLAMLSMGETNYTVVQFNAADELISRLQTQRFDLILVEDCCLMKDGSTLLKKIQQLCPAVPLIVVADAAHEDWAIATLHQGATDYVLKQRLERLIWVVQRALREVQERRDRQQVEERYQALVSVLPSMVWRVNAEGEFIIPQIDWQTYTGQSWEEYRGFGWVQALHPDDRDRLIDNWVQARNQRMVYKTGGRLWHQASGRYHYFEMCGVPLLNPDGTVREWVGTVTDQEGRQRTEAALRDRENHLRLIIESARDYAIFTLDLDGRITSWNSGAQGLLGYDEAEIMGQHGHIIFTPEDNARGEAETEMRKALTEGRAKDERWHLRKDGTRFWANGLLMPLRDESEHIHGFLKIMQDRTEHRRAEEAIRLSENRYRTLANAVSQLMWINDPAGNVQFFNQRWQDYTGVPLQQTLEFWQQSIHPEDLSTVAETRRNAIQAGVGYEAECRLQRFDQTYRWHLARVVPLKDEQGEILAWFGTATDIHEIKQVEAGQRFLAGASSILATSLDRDVILNNIAQLAVPFLADYCFFDMVMPNQKVQRTAWSHHDVAQRDWFDQVQRQDANWHSAAHLLENANRLIVEVTDEWMQAIAHNDLQLQFLRESQLRSLIRVPLQSHNGKLGVLTLCLTAASGRYYTDSDWTLAQELAHRAALALDNAQLYQQAQEANRIKDEFLAVLSHELRSPLNPILGWSTLLLRRKHDPEMIDRGLRIIERNVRLQTQLVEDLLDISRILRGKLNLNIQPIDLRMTIQAAMETAHLSAESKSIQIETHFEPNLGFVSGDSNRLQQVIWNLLSNAIKFTPVGGRVQIRLERESASGSRRNANSAQLAFAKITVTDTGRGISPDFLPYIFDYFRQADSSTTRQFGGLGLGLAIVRHLVELHGGTVRAESLGEGKGSTFTVRLPLLKQSSSGVRNTVSDRSTAILKPLLDNVRVLVVEDDTDTREILSFILMQHRAKVTVAESAAEALEVLAQMEVDVLVSDIGMPEMDGYTLMQMIRTILKKPQQLLAIALTAYAADRDRERAIAAGFQTHLSKPIDPDELVRVIHQLWGSVQTGDRTSVR